VRTKHIAELMAEAMGIDTRVVRRSEGPRGIC
jgi:hypothetical protein